MKAPSRPLIFVLIGVLVVALALAAVYVLQPQVVDDAVLALTGGTAEPAPVAVVATASPTPAEKTESTEAAPAPATNTGGTSGGGGASTGGKQDPAPDPKDPDTADGLMIRVLWWNDTKEKPAKGFEIVYDVKSVKPDVSKANGTASIGPVPVGKEVVLVVYPDGKQGKRFEVPFTVTKGMEANSDIDAIHVEVSDTTVRVLGNAVDNFDQSYPRF